MKYFFYIIVFTLFCGQLFAGDNPEISDSLFLEKINKLKNYEILNHELLLDTSNSIETSWTESIYKEAFSPLLAFTATLTKEEFNGRIFLKIFDLENETRGFGLYCLERIPSLEFQEIGFESYYWQNWFITWYGKYVISIKMQEAGENSEKYMKELSQSVVRLLPEQKRKTLLLNALPGKDKVKYSEKLVPFRWLGQPYFENTYYADYKISDGYCRIFIINNLTTSRADSNYWRYYDFIQKNANINESEMRIRTDYYVVNEPLWGRIVLAKKNQIIYGILDYKNEKWTEDRMEDILNYLRKNKIVKSG